MTRIGDEDILLLQNSFQRKLNATTTDFHRYLHSYIDWEDRLIGIKGPRGSGKTTLLLQHIKEDAMHGKEFVYISLDDLWFASHDIRDLVEYYYTHSCKCLFIDEVHYYPQWQTLIKNLYDSYPDLRMVFTGSSMLKINQNEGDLSRRLISYTLEGLSFREFLSFEKVLDVKAFDLAELISNHEEIAHNICSKVKVLPLFERYLKSGYFPFYKEVRKDYEQRIRNIVNQVLESDYPTIEKVNVATIRKAKKMLMLLAEKVPQKINMSQLFRELETDRNQGLKMLYALQRAGLVNLLGDKAKSINKLSRPEKIYLDNTNLMYALNPQINIGTMRETFFLNQLECMHQVSYPAQGDFLVDDKYLFEVGGRSKSFEQIKDIPYSFVVLDGVEYGIGNKIPLWLFGFLY